MTARSSRSFLPRLRELDAELAVPIGDRVRILQEIEYDLERLRDHLVTQGLPPDEAHRRAVAALVPDLASSSALARVHEPLVRRITGHLSQARLQWLQRAALATAMLTVVLVESYALLRVDVLSDASPFLWPVLLLGGVLAATVAMIVLRIWLGTDCCGAEAGASVLLVLAACILAVGIGGTLVDTYQLAATLERAPDMVGPLALQWLLRDAALLSVALLLAMAGGLAWFFLNQWLAYIAGAYHEALGITTTSATVAEKETIS